MADPRLERHNREQRRYFEEHEKRRMRPAATPYLQRHVNALARYAALRRGERVLEVGCGMGRYTFLLADRGLLVEGLDLSPVLLDRLRTFAGARYDIPLHAADVVDAPSALEGRFDAVVGLFTLHHLHDLPRCFQAMARLVHPGGRVAFLEPNPLNPLYYAQIAITPGMTWSGDGGIVHMRAGIVAAAMRASGLQPWRTIRFGFLPPFGANARGGRCVEQALERVRPLGPFLPFQLFGARRP